MSVAFRREEDDAHREPVFELPIPPGRNLVTQRGLRLLEERVAALEAALPGLDTEAAKPVARELRYWRTRLATAEPAPAPEEGVAGIGSHVTVRLNGAERRFAIVGHDEADPDAGLLAFSAPLARAVMGLEAGELADFGGRADAVELVAVDGPALIEP